MSETIGNIGCPFTADEAEAAWNEWGCNCGPAALAFALQRPLASIRGVIPGFEAKGYTSPTMMRSALDALGIAIRPYGFPRVVRAWFTQPPSLVRIQFTGPWTEPNANPKWGYRHTHWIAAYDVAACPMVFDINGGIRTFGRWKAEIVPRLTAEIKRADGGWFGTHVWRVV